MNLLLFDIGNTHTHLGLGNARRVFRQANVATTAWFDGTAPRLIRQFVGKIPLAGAALCSVVPRATPHTLRTATRQWNVIPLTLTPASVCGVGINYPRPKTIGPD